MIPKSFDEWMMRADAGLNSPEGALKMYFDAVFCYTDPSTRDEARRMLSHVMQADAEWDKRSSYATFASRLRDASYHDIFRSFAKGSSPQNGYAMNPDDYEIVIKSMKPESDYTRVLLVSSGADSPRSAWVKQYPDGKWYVINNAGLYVGVKPCA